MYVPYSATLETGGINVSEKIYVTPILRSVSLTGTWRIHRSFQLEGIDWTLKEGPLPRLLPTPKSFGYQSFHDRLTHTHMLLPKCPKTTNLPRLP